MNNDPNHNPIPRSGQPTNNANANPSTDYSQVQSPKTPIPNVNQSLTPQTSPGSLQSNPVNPPGDAVSVITSPHAPQKYGGKKIIATIFGLFLVVGGIVSGVALVQRQQNLSERAQEATTDTYDASCSEVRAYDSNWNQLNTATLEDLTAGTVVRFTVSGTTNSGSFDKARFTINGIQSPETTENKPGTQEFFYEYTIPEGVTNFTIQGQIHHTIWGWI